MKSRSACLVIAIAYLLSPINVLAQDAKNLLRVVTQEGSKRLGSSTSSEGSKRLGSNTGTGQEGSRRLGSDGSRRLTTESSQRLRSELAGQAMAETSFRLAKSTVKPTPTRIKPDRPTPKKPETSDADQLIADGKLDKAKEIYTDVLKTRPNDLAAQTGLGYALIKEGNYTEAVALFEKAVGQESGSPETHLNFGVALFYTGRVDEAIAQYQRAIKGSRQPFSSAHFNLALAYSYQNNFTKALEEYRTALKLRPNYAEAENNIGLVYQLTGNLDQAQKHFRQDIAVRNGNYPAAHYNLGRNFEIKSRFDEALTHYQQAIKQQQVFPEAYLNIGNIHLNNPKELDQAVAAFQQAIKQSDNSYPLAHHNLALAFIMKKNRDAALAEYRIAFDQYEGACPEVLNSIVSTVINDEGTFIFRTEKGRLSAEPENSSETEQLLNEKFFAEMNYALGKYEESEESTKDLPDIRYCAGRAYMVAGKWKSAIDEFARAVELSKGKDEQAKRMLVSVMELALYL